MGDIIFLETNLIICFETMLGVQKHGAFLVLFVSVGCSFSFPLYSVICRVKINNLLYDVM